MLNIFPIIAIGGALLLMSKKKSDGPKLKALPAAKDLGTVFGAGGQEVPDVITAKVGERFSVAFSDDASAGYSWKLTATPPDDVLGSVDPSTVPNCSPSEGKYCFVSAEGQLDGGSSSRRIFIFVAKEPGEGSIVMHLMPPGSGAPPAEILDIKVQITGA